MRFACLSYRHRERTFTPPRPVRYSSRSSAGSQMIWPPVGKSGASSVEATSWSGFFSRATVVSHTSPRLKPQIWDAMPTAMPWLADTSTLGKVVGSRDGSFMELS